MFLNNEQQKLSAILLCSLLHNEQLPYVSSFTSSSTPSRWPGRSTAFTRNTIDPRQHISIVKESSVQPLQMMDISDSIHMVTTSTSTYTNYFSNNFLTTAVETFDGSTIADPVVVSSVFWSSLQTKIISVIIGQILATIVFAGLSFVVSTQLTNIGDYLSKNLFRESTVNNSVDTLKKNVGSIAKNVQTKAQSPTVTPDFAKLLICLLIDIIGTSSELLPIVGELTDVIYAPIAALTLRSLFQGSNVVFALEFAEEFLPLTDVLPLATICWIVETFYGDSKFAQTLQIGVYGKNSNNVVGSNDTSIIDVVPMDDGKRNSNNTRF